MKNKIIAASLALPTLLVALEEKPWFGNCFELEGRASYAYSYFEKINHGVPQLKKSWHDNLLTLDLGTVVPENWSWEAEIQGDATTRRSFGYSSAAVQGRYLWLDDLCGDPVSLSFGVSLRETGGKSLKQFSTPYHSRFCSEFHTAVGKEWDDGRSWRTRVYGLGAIGFGNSGSGWWRANFFYMQNFCDKVHLNVYLLSYFGMGDKKRVNTHDFHGWKHIAHRSLDLGLGLRYLIRPWGSLSFDYLRRVAARSYPEQVNFFVFTYELPFSLV